MYITNFSGMVNQKVFRDLTTKYGEIIFNRDTYIYICIFIHIIYIYMCHGRKIEICDHYLGDGEPAIERDLYIYI